MFFNTESYFEDQARELGAGSLSELTSGEAETSDDFLINIPEALSSAVPFSRFLSECLDPLAAVLVLPTTWGVWPSSENWSLYYTLRRSDGGLDELHERPCHKFLSSEREKMQAYVFLFLAFGFDFLMLPLVKGEYVFVSHDGWAKVHNETNPDRIRAELSRAL